MTSERGTQSQARQGQEAVRVLVLNVDIGAGHRRAAQALCATIEALRPGSQHTIVEALEYLGPDGGRLAKELYLGVIQDLPDLWGMVYQGRELSSLLRPANELVDGVRTAALLPVVRELRPHVILAMHPIACGLGAALGRRRHLQCPVAAVLTDFDAHPAWVCRGIDLYLTATEQMADELQGRGLPSGVPVATGIPLRPAFSRIRNDSGAKARLGLPQERLTILLLGGGLGLGPIAETAKALAGLDGPLQLVVVAGANKELEQTCRGWARSSKVPMRVLGQVENVWDLMSASELAVGKAGGLTCAELMAAGVPLVALAPIPGQEQANCEFLASRGAALLARDAKSARDLVVELLMDPTRLEAMARAASRMGRPNAAQAAARRVLYLVGGQPDEEQRRGAPETDPLEHVSRASDVAFDQLDELAESLGRVGQAGLDAVADLTSTASNQLSSFAKNLVTMPNPGKGSARTGEGADGPGSGNGHQRPGKNPIEDELRKLRRKLGLD